MKKNGHRHPKRAAIELPEPPTADELARMKLPEHPLGEARRWVCRAIVTTISDAQSWRIFPMRAEITYAPSCAVIAQSAYEARHKAAVILGCEPGSVEVGVVEKETNDAYRVPARAKQRRVPRKQDVDAR